VEIPFYVEKEFGPKHPKVKAMIEGHWCGWEANVTLAILALAKRRPAHHFLKHLD
jgi:hypothetical protein